MKLLRKSFLFFLNLCLFHCSNPQSEEATVSDRAVVSYKIDSIAHHFLDQGKIMGLSIAVAKKDEIIYNKSFGFIDTAKTQKINNNHTFLLPSVSKLIGATMIMKLIEEGKLSLEDSLHKLLPDYPNEEQSKKIKLKHLLSHTSGLKDYASKIDSVYLATGIDPTYKDYFQFFEAHSLDFEPDTHFNYTNRCALYRRLCCFGCFRKRRTRIIKISSKR